MLIADAAIMDELTSAIAFLRSLGGHYTPGILKAAEVDGLPLPNMPVLTLAVRPALLLAGWSPPTLDTNH